MRTSCGLGLVGVVVWGIACQSEPAPDGALPSASADAAEKPRAGEPEVKAFGEADCPAYCTKQAACFPRAIEVKKERWTANCLAFCADDVKNEKPVTRLHAAVVACADAKCGDPFGACIAKAIDGAALEVDPKGLHDNCYAFRACIDARVFRFPFETPNARQTIYNENGGLFTNMKKVTDPSGTGCQGLVESAFCAYPAPREAEGSPIVTSCDDYCAIQAKCFPKYAASTEWLPKCKLGCEEEARLGTAAGRFFSAVASCKSEQCGDGVGHCVATALDESSAKTRWFWDVRGLGKKCTWLRMCLEASLLESDPQSAVISRKAIYNGYAKSFRDLKHDGGDAAAYCTSVVGYQDKCK